MQRSVNKWLSHARDHGIQVLLYGADSFKQTHSSLDLPLLVSTLDASLTDISVLGLKILFCLCAYRGCWSVHVQAIAMRSIVVGTKLGKDDAPWTQIVCACLHLVVAL